MTLITEVQVRFSAQRLIELTNPEQPNLKTINTTRLTAACTDAKAAFQRLTGIPFDDTTGGPTINGIASQDHWTIGVKGVLYFLYSYRALPGNQTQEKAKADFTETCRAYARTYDGSMTWISPVTNSNLTPTREAPGERPAFDPANMADLVPRSPATAPSVPGIFDNR